MTAAPGDRIDGVGPGGMSSCTLGIALAGSDGELYFTTAGHCSPDLGTFAGGHPDRVTHESGADLGAFVWAELTSGSGFAELRDMALIRVDEGVSVDPTMRVTGGPTELGVRPPPGAPLVFVGNGFDLARPRGGIAGQQTEDPSSFEAILGSSQGDSGSTVLDCSGRAIGVIHGWNVGVRSPLDDPTGAKVHGLDAVATYGAAIARAELALGVAFEVMPGASSFAPTPWCVPK